MLHKTYIFFEFIQHAIGALIITQFHELYILIKGLKISFSQKDFVKTNKYKNFQKIIFCCVSAGYLPCTTDALG